MKDQDIAAAVERLMNWVDYYLHCELDEEFQRDAPDIARDRLRAALTEELLRARAVGIVSSVSEATRQPTESRSANPR